MKAEPGTSRERSGLPSTEEEPGGPERRLALRGPTRDEVVRAVRHSTGIFLVLRISLSIVGLIAVAVLPDLTNLPGAIQHGVPSYTLNTVPGWPSHAVTPGWHNAFTAFERFDGLWFLSIAKHGYRNGNGSAAFFPLYPMVVRGVSWLLGGHQFGAALIVSNLAFLGALIVLYLLAAAEFTEEIARKAALYAAVFPTAFFFLAPYSESLFLLLALLALWFARRSIWVVAGAAAFLAALTRNIGVLLVAPLAAEAIHQGASKRRWPLAGLGASATPFLGAGVYLWFWHHLSGDWLAPIHEQASWERHRVSPITTIRLATQDAFRFVGAYAGGYHALDWVIGVIVAGAAVYALVRFRPVYGVYAWACILPPLFYIFDGRPLMSSPRFALVVFPVYWAFAKWTQGRPRAHELAVGASAFLMGLMFVLFANWYYIF